MKEEKRQQELNEFNKQLDSDVAQPNVAEEFKKLDSNKQLPQTAATSVNPELDRRRMIYKNIRKEISVEEQIAKQQAYEKKMTLLESRLAQRDQERKL